MKRINNLYNNMCNYSNIYNMYKKVRKTTKNKKEVILFERNHNTNLVSIMNKLYNHAYKFSKYKIFLINEPKYRLIVSENIQDKLVNHLVCKYILLPLEKCLIDTNVATRINRGGAYGLNKVIEYINTFDGNKEIYCLKIDIKKYFYNINHEILKSMLKNKIKDKYALDILFDVIDSTNYNYINEELYKIKEKEISVLKDSNKIEEINKIPMYLNGKGLPIGNVTSQFFAIFYLSNIDHYIKEELKIKCYVRYMDDLVLLSEDKNELIECFNKIKGKIRDIDLEINNKSKLYKLSNGFDFLGYRFKYKNKLKLSYSNKTYHRIIKRINNLHDNDYPLYYKSIRSYKGYFMKINSDNEYIIKHI